MKAYDELTRLGRIRRLRHVAAVALESYGLAGADFKFVRHAGNTLFRVYAPERALASETDDRYHQGQYLLRIHEPGYQTTEAIQVEMAWLLAMSREAGLPVSQPLTTLDGCLLTQVSVPGVPEHRNCSLLRWLRGRFSPDLLRARHYRAQGRLMAGLHQFSAGWRHPLLAAKRRWDQDGLFRDIEGTDMSAATVWPLVPQRHIKAFEMVADRTAQMMGRWGTGPDVYGLIHGDLGVDANVLFWRGEARAIDFDDSGLGYWMYDLAVSLEHVRDDTEYPRFRDALLEGYAEIRNLPDTQLEQLDLFMAAFFVYVSLWAAAMTQVYPAHRIELMDRLERAAGLVERYVSGS